MWRSNIARTKRYVYLWRDARCACGKPHTGSTVSAAPCKYTKLLSGTPRLFASAKLINSTDALWSTFILCDE